MTSAVTEEVEFLIRSRTGGGYVVFGPDYKRDFPGLEAAKERAMEETLREILERASAGGMGDCVVRISLEDEALALRDGMHYMETRIYGTAGAIVEAGGQA